MTTSQDSLLIQGAEAKVYEGTFCGRPAIFKERFVKTYRLPQLDDHLTKERMKNEARGLLRCRQAGVKAPALYHCDLHKRTLVTEKLSGKTLRECLKHFEIESKYELIDKVLYKVGELIGLMHKNHIVHGDLTTSNFIALPSSSGTEIPDVAIIDLGLSGVSEKAEEKAVDLYVLERAFISTHPLVEDRFKEVFRGYSNTIGNKAGASVLTKLEEVKLRGRKRTMEG